VYVFLHSLRVFAAYHYTPVKQPLHVVHEWHPGHLLVTVGFFLGVISFGIFAFVQFLQRPTTESFFLAPSSGTPIPIEVSISCSHAWACYKNATKPLGAPWQFDAAPSIVMLSGATQGGCTPSPVNVSATNGLAQIELNNSLATSSSPAGSVVLGSAQVCYSPSSADGLLISVPGFTAAGGVVYGDANAPRLHVRIRGVAQSFGNAAKDSTLASSADMDIQLDIEPHQRKSVFIGAVLRKRTKESVLASLPLTDSATTDSATATGDNIMGAVLQPYMADLFYEGKNDGTQAHLRVRVRQYVDVFNVSRPGDVLGMFASIGGFAATWGALMALLLMLSELVCLNKEKRIALDVLRERQALAGIGLAPLTEQGAVEADRMLGPKGAHVRIESLSGELVEHGVRPAPVGNPLAVADCDGKAGPGGGSLDLYKESSSTTVPRDKRAARAGASPLFIASANNPQS
jgi:hypothetical protein